MKHTDYTTRMHNSIMHSVFLQALLCSWKALIGLSGHRITFSSCSYYLLSESWSLSACMCKMGDRAGQFDTIFSLT